MKKQLKKEIRILRLLQLFPAFTGAIQLPPTQTAAEWLGVSQGDNMLVD